MPDGVGADLRVGPSSYYVHIYISFFLIACRDAIIASANRMVEKVRFLAVCNRGHQTD